MHIQWNKVTWYSKLLAVLLFVGVFWLGFDLGHYYGLGEHIITDKGSSYKISDVKLTPANQSNIRDVSYTCSKKETIYAFFRNNGIVYLGLPDGKSATLIRVSSSSSNSYANEDRSVVFLDKGELISIEENGAIIHDRCIANRLKNNF